MRNLQTDYLDPYLILLPDESRPYSEPMEAFADFKSQGKIQQGRVSNFRPAMMEESRDKYKIVTNQVGYFLFDFRPETEILPFCRENIMGVVA